MALTFHLSFRSPIGPRGPFCFLPITVLMVWARTVRVYRLRRQLVWRWPFAPPAVTVPNIGQRRPVVRVAARASRLAFREDSSFVRLLSIRRPCPMSGNAAPTFALHLWICCSLLREFCRSLRPFSAGDRPKYGDRRQYAGETEQ